MPDDGRERKREETSPSSMSLLTATSLLLPPHQILAGGGGGSGPLVQWVFSDPIGSGVLVTNSNATSLMRRHFEPFGRVVHETAISGTWPRPQFAGHLDDGIGLYDFRARHYDPDAAQFVQIDPLVPDPYQPADLNPYGYVRNDPLNATDPTGEFVISGGITLGAILAAAAYGAALAYGAYVLYDSIAELTQTEQANLPDVGWLQASVSSLETALPDRSVATRTGLGPTDIAAVSHSFLSSGSARPQEAAVWSWVRWAPRILRLAKKTITDVLARRAATKKAAEQATRGKILRPETVRSGGRGGQRVLDIEGPPNSIIRGQPTRSGGPRAFETDEAGRVVREITPDRVKIRQIDPKTGREFFEKSGPPSADDLRILDELVR